MQRFLRKNGWVVSAVRAVVLLLCAGCCVAARAQEITATILGRVTDPSGAALPGAAVTVTDTDTGLQIRATQTNGEGEFTATLLPVGHYTVRATAAGFEAEEQRAIDLHASDRLNVVLKLKPGSASATVTVTADELTVQTQTAASDMLISSSEIKELSINNRNFLGLLAILPGVTSTASSDELTIGAVNPTGSVNSLPYSLNGGRVSANSYLLDGADNLDRGANTTLINTPSVDAIQEFKVIRGVYSAEFGRNAASQINVITKAGTNQFHGDIYEFFRNDVLDANNALYKLHGIPRPALRYNDFGGTIGGPVILPKLLPRDRERMFFFFSEEVRRIIDASNPTSGIAASANLKQGIFLHPVCQYSSTGACTAVTSIPSTSWDPISAEYVKDVFDPVPNGDPNSFILVSVGKSVYNLHQELGRVDYAITPQETMAVRYIRDAINTVDPFGYQVSSLIPDVSTTQTHIPGGNLMVRLTSVLRPSLLNEAAVDWTSGQRFSVPVGTLAKQNAPDVHVPLPFPSTLGNVPGVGITEMSGAKGFGPYIDYNRNYNFFDNVTWVTGRQTVRAGVTFNYYQKTENNASTNAGQFTFPTSAYPTGGDAIEQAWANFLQDYKPTFSQTSLDLKPDMRQTETELYLQDDVRLLPSFTMNAGVRYSIYRQPWDHRDMLTNFDPYTFSTLSEPHVAPCATSACTGAGVISPGTGNPFNGIIQNNTNSPWGDKVDPEAGGKFAPRLGFAWSPAKNGKTVLRGGYGLIWDSTLVGIYENNIFANPPYLVNLSVASSSFENPAPNAVGSYASALHGTPIPTKLPYEAQYSLDFQQQLGSTFLLDVGYYGSKGTHLLGIADINEVAPGQFHAETGYTAALSTTTNPYVNAYRPYPGYTAINAVEDWFGSNYNSLQVAAQKRFKLNSTLRVAYTWQKTMTDAGTDRNNAPQWTGDIRDEYAIAPFNRKEMLVLSYVYKIPFASAYRAMRAAFAGWEVSGITSFDQGLSTQVDSGSGADTAQLGVEGDGSSVTLRPDMLSNPNQNAPHTLLQWFNTAAYKDVPNPATTGVYRVGTSKPTSLIGPGFQQWDFSVFRNFAMGRAWTGQFRVESFNVFNHTNPQGLFTSTDVTTGAGTVNSSAFGAVSSVREPRRLQLGLKLNF